MVKHKRAFALLALAMASCVGVFSLVGDALAAGSCPMADSLEIEGQVLNEAELRYAMLGNNDVSEVKVGNDFTITCDAYPDTIKKNFTLDLNGNTITSQIGWALDIESAGKTLTIKDTTENANGAYVFTEGGFWVDAGANLTIESGNIRSVDGGRRAILMNGGGKLTINGGNISTTPQKTDDGNGRTILVYGSTVEMNGGTVSVSRAEGSQNVGGVFYVQGSDVLINNGEILANEGNGIRAINDSQITFKNGRVLGGNEVISLEDSNFTMEGGEIYATGVAVYTAKEAEFAMSDGFVVSENSFALAGNGSVDSGTGEPLNGNTIWSLEGGTIISQSTTAIYQPQVGDTYLGEELQVIGKKSGIEIRAGDLTVEGALVSANGDAGYGVEANGGGITTTGAAIAVAQHTTKKPINVSIKDGVFVGPVAFSETNPQNNPSESIEKVQLEITGGTFSKSSESAVIISEDVEKFVTGGVYNEEPENKYIIEGYDAGLDDNDSWLVVNLAELDAAGDEIDHDENGDKRIFPKQIDFSIDGIKSGMEEGQIPLWISFGNELLKDRKATLSAVEVEAGELKLSGEGELIGAFDATMFDRNNESIDDIQNNDLTIRIAINEETYDMLGKYDKLYAVYFDDDGIEVERFEATLNVDAAGTSDWAEYWIEFHTSHLSTYGIVGVNNGETTEDGSAGTVDAATPETGTVTMAGASASVASIVTAFAVGIMTSIISFAYLIRRR